MEYRNKRINKKDIWALGPFRDETESVDLEEIHFFVKKCKIQIILFYKCFRVSYEVKTTPYTLVRTAAPPKIGFKINNYSVYIFF
jgi:hypothetical protein